MTKIFVAIMILLTGSICALAQDAITITTVAGTSTAPATEDNLGILMGCNLMLVNPSLKESPLIAYDEMRWAKDKGLIKGTHLNLGETSYLGYKCKTISVENGMLTYFQNVCLKTDKPSCFRRRCQLISVS